MNEELRYIRELFGKIAGKTCTPEEKARLLDWISRPENEKIAGELIDQYMLEKEADKNMPQDSAESILESIFSVEPRREAGRVTAINSGQRGIGKWLAAASVILLLTLGGFFFFNGKNKITGTQQLATNSEKVEVDVLPGGEGAILTLADGRQIVLDSLGNGIIAEEAGAALELNNGQLAYNEADAASGTSEIVYHTLSTPKGRQFSLLLPDGSRVWLNAASSIRFPVTFESRERRVKLNGEAYFEVKKTGTPKRVPFIVETRNQTIEVLGTSFNVNAYDDEDAERTTLLEGSLRVAAIYKSDATENGGMPEVIQQDVVLVPGQQVAVSPSGKLGKAVMVPTDEVMAWKSGLFKFRSTDLASVMRQAERWYDINVEYPRGIPSDKFTGDISMDVNLSSFMKILEYSDVTFKITPEKVIITP
ncbi:MAG TPA: FecR domain-containing protein [Parasegetibacter sp.]